MLDDLDVSFVIVSKTKSESRLYHAINPWVLQANTTSRGEKGWEYDWKKPLPE